MEIINDTEVFEPSECFFAVDLDPDDPSMVLAYITDKEYWEAEHLLNDGIGYHSFRKGAIPSDFCETMEAVWDTELSLEDARQSLIKAGFIECPEMKDLVNGQ